MLLSKINKDRMDNVGNKETEMHDPENLYLCFRPETKSTKPHAACRQYVFETTRELLKWLRSRKNSTEQVQIQVFQCHVLTQTISGPRNELCCLEQWPLD